MLGQRALLLTRAADLGVASEGELEGVLLLLAPASSDADASAATAMRTETPPEAAHAGAASDAPASSGVAFM